MNTGTSPEDIYGIYRTDLTYSIPRSSHFGILPHTSVEIRLPAREVPDYCSCSVTDAVTPILHAKTKRWLYHASSVHRCWSRKRLSQRLPEWKIPGPAAEWKKHIHACTGSWLNSHRQEQLLLFLHAAAGSRRSVLGQAQGIKKESAGQKKWNPVMSLSYRVPISTTNKWVNLSGKTQSAAPHQRAWLAYFIVIRKAWVSSQCNAHNCFYPLENKLVRSRVKLICEQCLPFFSPPSRQPINDIKD